MYNDKYGIYKFIDCHLGESVFSKNMLCFTFKHIEQTVLDSELEKMKKDELIIEALPGVFYNKIKVPFLDDFYIPSYSRILETYAAQNFWHICETVSYWLNFYRMDTQIPARYEYLSTGPDKEVQIFGTKAFFKHTDEDILKYGTKYTAGFYYLLEYLGEEYFQNPTDRERFIKNVKELGQFWISNDDGSSKKYMKPWMVEIFEKIC